jgi:hypothetical protein
MPRAVRFAYVLGTAKKALLLAGPAAILMGAGTANAATIVPSAHPSASAASQLSAASRGRGPAAILDVGSQFRHGAVIGQVAAGDHARAQRAPGKDRAGAHGSAPADRTRARGSAAPDHARAAHRTVAAKHRTSARHTPPSWQQVAQVQAHRADPRLGRGPLPAADRLQPVAAYGPQQYMPLDSAQLGNATTIVHQALARKMGVRSAVIAVATAMQESGLTNVDYGTSDSLGLFQQRPSCGWGTAQQIMDPAYAANAFLTALQRYQAANPSWASQPLYQAAQGVQASAYPTAYAKWEAQAAGLVKTITTSLTA